MSRRRRRGRISCVDNSVPWMAIAAAGSTSSASRRRSHRGIWFTGSLVVLVLAAGAVYAVHRSTRSGSSAGSGRVTRASSAADPTRHPKTTHHHPATRRATDPFTASLTKWLRHRDGDITAAVEDLHSGREWVYRPGHPEHTASIVKVDILATLLHQHQNDGGLSEEDRELATGMIESSDDDDATDLWNAVGGASAVQDFDDEVGMHQTATNIAWGLTRTTPEDQLKLLRTVFFNHNLLDRASRDYEYNLMRHIIPFDTWGVTAGPLGHAKVAFKNGWLPYQGSWQVNSIGSVDGAGRHYLIAVMTVGSATEGYGIDTIEQIARTAWTHLDVARR
jgi:hypothetical protein